MDMWCPQCQSEYRAGIDRCAVCDVRLTDELPDERLPRQAPTLMQPVYLRTFRTQMELGMARELLSRNDIACFCKQPGSGSYLLIMCGASMYGSDVYVDQAALARAQELLDSVDGPCDEGALNAAYDAFMQASPELAAGAPDDTPPSGRRPATVILGICIFIFISPALYALLLRLLEIVRGLLA